MGEFHAYNTNRNGFVAVFGNLQADLLNLKESPD